MEIDMGDILRRLTFDLWRVYTEGVCGGISLVANLVISMRFVISLNNSSPFIAELERFMNFYFQLSLSLNEPEIPEGTGNNIVLAQHTHTHTQAFTCRTISTT